MQRTKLLIVDDDPDLFELAEQILPKDKFELFHAVDGVDGIEQASQHKPDLILLDLVMPGLTGNDMLVGIKQKQYQGPIVVTPKRGDEVRAIEAFRLGATDFVTKPIRPPELMAVIERALEEVRLRQEKATLLDKVQAANAELEQSVKELRSLTNITHLLAGMRGIDELLDIVLTGMLDMTGADHATIILKDPGTGKLILSAGKNLTLVMQEKMGEEIKDELAELVLTSREPLVAAGEGLQRFKLSREIRAVVYVPMFAKDNPIGVLTIGNHKKRAEFDMSHANLLRAIGDHVAIAINNARTFSALDVRAKNMEAALRARESEAQAQAQMIQTRLEKPLADLTKLLAQFGKAPLPDALKGHVSKMQAAAHEMNQALQDVTEATERPSRGIYRISPK